MSSPPPVRAPLFTRNFVLVWLITLTAFGSFYFLLATLPLYIIEIGASEAQVGLIIGVFASTALPLRLIVGREADVWGRRRLILGGCLVLLLSSVLYTWTISLPALLALRILHGAGWAAFGTAAAAVAADVVPPQRRGEGMGYYGMSINVAMVVGPIAGIFILQALSFLWVFLAAGAVAALSVVFAALLTEPHTQRPNQRGPLLEPPALFPSAMLGMMALTYGSIVSFLPVFAVRRGLDNPGLFFTVFALALVLFRAPAGRLSDRYGRGATIIPGLVLAAAGLGLLSTAASVATFMVAAVLYGLAFALVQPALMALMVDRVSPARRGAAMGSFTAAMDLGIGGGAFLWGFVAQAAGFPAMYQAAAVAALVALGVFLAGSRRKSCLPLPCPHPPPSAKLCSQGGDYGPGEAEPRRPAGDYHRGWHRAGPGHGPVTLRRRCRCGRIRTPPRPTA
jgi:MFS family permease